jgi:molybdopterin molybdotransferase
LGLCYDRTADALADEGERLPAEPKVKQSVSVEEARRIILGSLCPMGTEMVSLPEALGRVLAETAVAPWDIPPRDNSAMDGYAVRASDVACATSRRPITLKVLESIPAGRVGRRARRPGTAARIMTGAPVPAGADAVIRVEDTEGDGNEVRVRVAVKAGTDIRRAAEDVRAGKKVIEAGSVLTPAAIGMLAALGRASVRVTQRPRVAVLSTGDELVEVDGDRRDGKIIATNTYSLSAQVREAGALPVALALAPDTPEAIESRFREAMSCDVIISSGGVSVGAYDFVKGVLEGLGSEMKFWRVAMKPGYPLIFGLLQGKPAFGLPGNPVSCMVSFEQFVRPSLLKMMGHRDLFRPVVRARLRESLRQKPGRLTFVRARVSREASGLSVVSTGNQSSGVLLSMVRANGLLLFPADKTELPEGSEVEVQIIDPAFWQQPAPDA